MKLHDKSVLFPRERQAYSKVIYLEYQLTYLLVTRPLEIAFHPYLPLQQSESRNQKFLLLPSQALTISNERYNIRVAAIN